MSPSTSPCNIDLYIDSSICTTRLIPLNASRFHSSDAFLLPRTLRHHVPSVLAGVRRKDLNARRVQFVKRSIHGIVFMYANRGRTYVEMRALASLGRLLRRSLVANGGTRASLLTTGRPVAVTGSFGSFCANSNGGGEKKRDP
ncbi:hypothetical protein Trydic_g21217 [Trypoxylus dichotomus]